MYSVEELIEQIDQASDIDDDLENVVEQHSENEAEEATENADNNDKEDSAKKVAKKVKKPSNRPKLDAERLKGPRGLPYMERLFTKIQFAGNGHEQEDLQAVMKTMQYWCHRLFPKYSFDDCLEHLERLGSKKPVITLRKKILFDLFEEDQPLVNDADDANLNADTQEAINEFDLLLQQEPINTLSQRTVSPERVVQLTDEQKETIERNRLIAAERRKARLEALQQKQDVTINSELTEEQKAIIERNRLLAIEKRRARNNVSTISSEDVDSTSDTTPSTVALNSQKSSYPGVDFNELVDSFFPSTNEENPQNSVDEEVDINDLIEEMNPTNEENSDNLNKSTEAEIDINDLLEEINETTTIAESEKMDIDVESESKNSDQLVNETSHDLNSTKEDTAQNLLELK